MIVPFQVAERSGVQFKLSHLGDQWIFSWPPCTLCALRRLPAKTLFLALITQFNIPFSLLIRKSSEVFEDFFVERRSFACRNWSLNVLLFYCNWKKWNLEELAAVQRDLERADKTNKFQTCLQKSSFFDVFILVSKAINWQQGIFTTECSHK